MKVGMITFYAADNYGTCLQAFALQRAIEHMGYDVKIIQYYRDNSMRVSKYSIIERIKALINAYPGLSILYYPLARKAAAEKKRKFKLFREEYLLFSSLKYTSYEELLNADAKYDAFVCGSDMIWSDIGQNRDVYFLKFAEKYKRISYAPSLTGVSLKKDIQYDYLKEAIEGISYLSFREESGVAYAKWATDRDAFLAPDPTLLLVSKEWKELFNVQVYTGRKYILCYLFEGIPDTLLKKVKNLAEKGKFDIRFIPMQGKEYWWENRKGSITYGPKEFVELFANASFIITNSYHGLMFSLIFKKPFIVVHRHAECEWKSFETRMSDMLDVFDQKHRFLNPQADITKELLELDYTRINSKLSALREASYTYLKNALASVMKESQFHKIDHI